MAAAKKRNAQTGARTKILRIGVILGGKIVEERLIRDRGDVTIGQSAKNTFGIPSAELPKTWNLFEEKDGRYYINIAEGMDGRISDGGQVQTLSQLSKGGQAQKQGSGHAVPLTEQARGKVMLGELTLLFQFVMAPPVQPKPQLPQSVRGSVMDRIDPYMAAILALSFLFHGGMLIWLATRDLPTEPEPDEIPDRFAKGLLERPPPPPEPPPAPIADEGPGKDEPVAKKGGPDEGKKQAKDPGPDKDPGPAQPDQAAVAAAVENTAVLKVLGAVSQDGQGKFVDVSGGKDGGGDLDKGLQNVSGSGVAIAGAGGLGTRGGGDGTIGSGSRTGVSGPTGGGGAGDKGQTEVKVDVKTTALDEVFAGGLDPSAVMSVIKQRYYRGIQQCYQSALKTNPKLAGKINIGFVIGKVGKVTSSNIGGFDPGVDACVRAQVMRWRFSRPDDDEAEFQIGFILRPGS